MKTNRRTFMKSAIAGGLGLAVTPASFGAEALNANYALLDDVLAQPVLKRELFQDPVVIERLDLLRYRNGFLCRVRSSDGAEGISVAHTGMNSLYPIFKTSLKRFFIGKDARDLDLLLDKVYIYNLNFRLSGMALGIPLATIEFAILDMLGRVANRPMGQLIGDIHHPQVPVYQATEYREKSVEASLGLIKRDVARYNANAVKIKIGGLMFMTTDIHALELKTYTPEEYDE